MDHFVDRTPGVELVVLGNKVHGHVRAEDKVGQEYAHPASSSHCSVNQESLSCTRYDKGGMLKKEYCTVRHDSCHKKCFTSYFPVLSFKSFTLETVLASSSF